MQYECSVHHSKPIFAGKTSLERFFSLLYWTFVPQKIWSPDRTCGGMWIRIKKPPYLTEWELPSCVRSLFFDFWWGCVEPGVEGVLMGLEIMKSQENMIQKHSTLQFSRPGLCRSPAIAVSLIIIQCITTKNVFGLNKATRKACTTVFSLLWRGREGVTLLFVGIS